MNESLIVVASDLEYGIVKKLTKKPVLKLGIGSANVIESLKNVDKGTKLINIGYAGSNCLPVGSMVKVKNSFLYHPIADYNYKEPNYCLTGDVDCYTSGDFVISTDIKTPVVFDMELNTICALGFKVDSYKIVSDNLSTDQYEQSSQVNLDECWIKILKGIED